MADKLTPELLSNFLKEACLFQIYRFSKAIMQARDEPARIDRVRNALKLGQQVEYFHSNKNTLVLATVIKKNPKYVVMENCDDQSRWKVAYFAVKLDDRAYDFHQKSSGLNQHTVAVGDIVGFQHKDGEIVGTVHKVNPKTVSLITRDGERWRAYYDGLYGVIEGDAGQGQVIQYSLSENSEGENLNANLPS